MKKLLTLALLFCVASFAAAPQVAPFFFVNPPVVASGGGAYDPATDANMIENLDMSTQTGSNDDPIGTVVATTGKDGTSSGTARPTLRTGANGKNSLNILRFDGTQQYTKTANFTSTITQPYSTVLVFRYLSGGGGTIFDANTDNPTRGINHRGNGTVVIFSDIVSTITTDNTNWKLVVVEWNGSSSKWYLNGGSGTTMNPAVDTSLKGIVLGSYYGVDASFSNIEVAQIIVRTGTFDSVPAVFTYFNNKWAIY